MALILQLALAGGLVLLLAAILPGVQVKNYGHALLTAVLIVAGIYVAQLLITPVNWLTLGLFRGLLGFIVSVLVVLLVDKLLDGFKIKGLGWAVVFALLFGLGNYLIGTAL